MAHPHHMPVHHWGTRFRLFPQLPGLEAQGEPETVWVSSPVGSLMAGPADERMYVIDPLGKERPYGFYPGRGGGMIHYKPPWDGPVLPMAEPDSEGHFDHIPFGTPQFEQAHAFGTARFTLDVWEDYFGRPIDWHFREYYDRLEILFLRGLDNAYAGFGSVEIGSYKLKTGEFVQFGLSFDVIAHEVGHLIIYSEIGMPDTHDIHGEYFGFHESAADMVSLVALMHFDSALKGVLEASRGNLYTYNRLNRFGEVSDLGQLRLASNPLTLHDFTEGWVKEHKLAQPLTGALFDIWVDVFHEHLLEEGLISSRAEDLSDRLESDPHYHDIIQPVFDEAYARDPEGFAEALVLARDYMGVALANTWQRLGSEHLDYADVFRALMAADRDITNGRFQRIINVNMSSRGIGQVRAGPRLEPPDAKSHAFSARTATPDDEELHHGGRCLSYRERMALARGEAGWSF